MGVEEIVGGVGGAACGGLLVLAGEGGLENLSPMLALVQLTTQAGGQGGVVGGGGGGGGVAVDHGSCGCLVCFGLVAVWGKEGGREGGREGGGGESEQSYFKWATPSETAFTAACVCMHKDKHAFTKRWAFVI